jgi:hypothetical protein
MRLGRGSCLSRLVCATPTPAPTPTPRRRDVPWMLRLCGHAPTTGSSRPEKLPESARRLPNRLRVATGRPTAPLKQSPSDTGTRSPDGRDE